MPTTRAGVLNCPICGSDNTGIADGEFKATGFQAFPNRCCYVCDAAWTPDCPKWAAVVSILGGCVAALLAFIFFGVNGGNSKYLFAGVFALPVLYGLGVLLGKTGKMKILARGKSPMAKIIDPPEKRDILD